MTWLLLVYSPFVKEFDILESSVEDVANSFQGAIEVGILACMSVCVCFLRLHLRNWFSEQQ